MQALRLTQPGQLDLVSAETPAPPGPDEVLVRIRRVGVCGTDLHAYQGKQTFFTYPRVLGHELGVEVMETGAGVSALRRGDLCSVEPFLNCGQCPPCRMGKTNCCRSLRTLGVHIDGGMTGAIVVPAGKLHRSTVLTLEQLAVVEPLCIGAHAFARPELNHSDTVLVIGGGPIGLAVVEAARAHGMEPLLMEMSRRRLQFAQQIGLHTIDASLDALEQIRGALDGDLPRCVFDCTGSPRSMMAAFELVDHGGKLVFVGHYPGEITFQNPNFHAREITLYASRNATTQDFKQVMALLESGRIRVEPWLADPVAPHEVAERFPFWLDPENGVIKPIIAWAD
ncbi:MAG: zinc-binding alcohol dehydrogenase family protein [Acidobacteriia bacterium]|nr:zinc-binding alcohol dehydrogenase family protein [Terriglobia bacterium]